MFIEILEDILFGFIITVVWIILICWWPALWIALFYFCPIAGCIVFALFVFAIIGHIMRDF